MNSQGLTAAEFALFRGIITILVAKFLLYKDGLNVTSGLQKEHMTPIYLRSIIGTLASILTIYIVKILPLTLFFIIFQTSPILIAVLCWVWLRESISSLECYAIFGSYGGILIMSLAKPSGESEELNDKYKYTLGIILSVICSASMAVTAVSTR
jgi:drug/metabolite transporter (DMT)-like permease